MISRGGEWDIYRLLSCPNNEVLNALRQKLLYVFEGVDKRVWSYTNNGEYSVKSGYEVLHKCDLANTEQRLESFRLVNAVEF